MPSALRVPIGTTDLRATLRPLALLAGDPTVSLAPGRFERASVTPEGTGTIVVTWQPGDQVARVDVFGDGGAWLRARAGRLLGCEDDAGGFAPEAEPLRALWRRHRGMRISRTGTLWHDLACFVVQQRINGLDAAAQWRRLVRALGERAPGPSGLTAPPRPASFAHLDYSDLHLYGIERQRAATLLRAAWAVTRLEGLVDQPARSALPALAAIPGVGRWTTGSVAARTWGEPDAVILGDYGIPSMVAWALAGEPSADDERLLELLEPYRPHRYRVIQLAGIVGPPPRRHPRGRRTDIRRF